MAVFHLRIVARIARTLILAASVTAGAAQAAEPTQDEIAEAMRLATVGTMQARAGQYEVAITTLASAVAAPGYEVLPPDTRLAAQYMLAAAEALTGASAAGYQRLRGTMDEFPDTVDGHDWALAARFAINAEIYGDAIDAALKLVRDYEAPDLYWDDGLVTRIVAHSTYEEELAAARYDLMEAVWDSGTEPEDPFRRPDSLWFDLLLAHVERGETAKARSVIVRLNDPVLVAALYYDKRFERFATTIPAGGFSLAMARELEWARKLVNDFPRELRAVNRLASTLTRFGHFEESLATVDAAIAAVNDAEDASTLFDDVEDELPWLHDERGRLLMRLGRHEESLTAMVAARDTSTEGVSHDLNLGNAYILHGDPEAALEALQAIKPARQTPYGHMVEQWVIACASSLVGDEAKVAEALGFLLENADDGQAVLQEALFCTNDLDAAAALLVKRLEDPDTRSDVLDSLQRYEEKRNPTEMERLLDGRFDAVREYPEVQATIAKYGKVIEWPLPRL